MGSGRKFPKLHIHSVVASDHRLLLGDESALVADRTAQRLRSFLMYVVKMSPLLERAGLQLSAQKLKQGTDMRILIICALVLTGTVGLGGCFHHQKAVTQEPLKLG